MVWQKGQSGNLAGRKGFEMEREQLERMKRILTKYLVIIEKVLDGESNSADYSKLMAISSDVRKILDKLHASKQDVTSDGEQLPTPILNVLYNDSHKENNGTEKED